MPKLLLQVFFVLLPIVATAQTDDLFMVKKPEGTGAPVNERDTFMRQVFASTKPEVRNRIAYVTAVQIENEQSLILFKATQGIMDTLKWFTDKNATAGDWHKLKYESHNDTLYFTYTLTMPQRGNSKKMVTVTHSYIAVRAANALGVTEVVSSDNEAQIPPRIETCDYTLVNQIPVVRRKPIK